MTSTRFLSVAFTCFGLLPSSVLGATIRVDSTGISIGPDSYPVIEDLIVPDSSLSPFFSLVLGGVRDGLLSRMTPAGTHINFDGSGVFADGFTGSLGTYTYTMSIPAGGFQFVDVSGLPPEPFIPAGFLLSTVGTLVSVSGPGLSGDPLVGTTGWHNKIVLTGPYLISGGTPLNALPDAVFQATATHASVMGIAFHSSKSPEPQSVFLIGAGLIGVFGLARGRRPRG